MENKEYRVLTLGNPWEEDYATREAYKALRTNLMFCGSDKKVIAITSCTQNEGKSTISMGVAMSLAEVGKKVLLIDADLRRPAVARLLVEKASPGLSEILMGDVRAEEALRKEAYPNLDIIFSGEIPPNPSELLSSERMQNLIEFYAEQYDYILVDTPPVNVVTDACIVANLLDGVLLLAWQKRSKKDAIRQAVNNLKLTGANVLGYILNGVVYDDEKHYGSY